MKERNIDLDAKKAGFYYVLGNIILKGTIFLLLPVFTRLLNTSDFGYYNTYMAFEQILIAIFGLGLYGTLKNARIDFGTDFNEYFSNILLLELTLLVIVEILINFWIFLKGNFLGYNFFLTNLLILQSFGGMILNIYGIKLNVDFKYKKYLFFSGINVFGSIVVSILLIIYVFPHERYIGRILGSALPLILIATIVWIKFLFKKKYKIKITYFRYGLLLGIPLIPHVLAQSMLNQLDRIMIKDMIGSSETGIYSYVYSICTILFVVQTSLENSWNPWMFIQLNNKNEKQIYEISKKMIVFVTIICIGFMSIAPEIAKLFSSESYWDGIKLVFILSFSMHCIFLYTLPANIEYYYKQPWLISVGTIMALGINVILNYIFIKVFGYEASAYTTATSYFFLFIFHWNFAKLYGVERIYSRKIIFLSMFIVFMISIVFTVTYRSVVLNFLIRYSSLLLILYTLFKHREKIVSVIKGRSVHFGKL